MRLDIVTPERRLLSTEAATIQLPGSDGDMTVMENHERTITTLRPGILKAQTAQGEQQFAVTAGFAEITPEACTVIAEVSLAVGDVTQDIYDGMVAGARKRHEELKAQNLPGPTDEAAKLLADMVAMGTHIGLSPRS
jgi:F-type H+-transporting ATPase subunit epsilon